MIIIIIILLVDNDDIKSVLLCSRCRRRRRRSSDHKNALNIHNNLSSSFFFYLGFDSTLDDDVWYFSLKQKKKLWSIMLLLFAMVTPSFCDFFSVFICHNNSSTIYPQILCMYLAFTHVSYVCIHDDDFLFCLFFYNLMICIHTESLKKKLLFALCRAPLMIIIIIKLLSVKQTNNKNGGYILSIIISN